MGETTANCRETPLKKISNRRVTVKGIEPRRMV